MIYARPISRQVTLKLSIMTSSDPSELQFQSIIVATIYVRLLYADIYITSLCYWKQNNLVMFMILIHAIAVPYIFIAMPRYKTVVTERKNNSKTQSHCLKTM